MFLFNVIPHFHIPNAIWYIISTYVKMNGIYLCSPLPDTINRSYVLGYSIGKWTATNDLWPFTIDIKTLTGDFSPVSFFKNQITILPLHSVVLPFHNVLIPEKPIFIKKQQMLHNINMHIKDTNNNCPTTNFQSNMTFNWLSVKRFQSLDLVP